MSVELQRGTDEAPNDFSQYRALSTLAVMSLVVGLLSSLALLDWVWLPIAVAGVLLGAHAWRKVNSRRDELSGAGLAKTGLVLSALCLVGGPARLSYEYKHEVPDGYARISYDELQPNPAVPGELVPPSAKALDEKKVFIKGYVYYTGQQKDGIESFLLVRDQGDCCFGGNPKISDRIQVRLVDPLRLTYSTRLHKVAGVMHVKPQAATELKGGVYYYLEADHLQ
jgi:hypothetical protein